MLKIFLLNSFYEFFFLHPNLTIIFNSTRQEFGLDNTYISNCLFMDLFFISGSAIYILQDINLLIECSYFKNCLSIKNGGAIFYKSNLKSCILYKNIGNNCFITPTSFNWEIGGQFSSVTVSNSKKNENSFSSISLCGNSTISCGSASILMIGGSINLNNYNSTNNICDIYSSSMFKINNYSKIYFSNIINNLATFHGITSCYGGNQYVNHSNFINNSSPQYGIIHLTVGSNGFFENSIFQNNKGNTFDLFQSQLTILNSFFDSLTFSRGSATTSNIFYGYIQTYQLIFFRCFNHFTINRKQFITRKKIIQFLIFLYLF